MYKEPMIYISSDIHFGHQSILKFCPKTRPYSSIDEMDEAIIRDWNRVVTPRDLTYLLGDISFREPSRTAKIFSRLNGKKILIAGNHDEKHLKHKIFRDCFEEIHNYLELRVNKQKIVLFHYPIAEWNGMYRGAVHLHGHLHGNPSGLEEFRARDAGMDATGKVVVTIEGLVNDALTGKIKSHHV